jgi:hypothetical protein
MEFSTSNITPEAKLEFEEMLGKGEKKSSQPKRKSGEGEIEDVPIDDDYPLKVPKFATKAQIKQKAEEQRETKKVAAVALVTSDKHGGYIEAVLDCFMGLCDTPEIVKECVACKTQWTTWESSFTLCSECEDAFLALVTEE